ncbi:trigger factor [cyanobiont of Ornithocercus magnificus]|nr:trigger factor [cyanobiont of Ornithocercus magnificus]
MSAADLKVTTETRPGSRLLVVLTVSAERCHASYEGAIRRLSRSVKLPGFRKGQVPRPVLLQQVGSLRIRANALEDLIETVWQEALERESIEALGQPEISAGFEVLLDAFRADEALTVTLETDIAPTPKLKATKGLKAEVEKVDYDPNRIDEMLEQSRKQLATLVPVEGRAAKSGDVAVVSFRGTYSDDGSELEGGNTDTMDVDLEDDQIIPGFTEGIIGMAIGDERAINCRFPDDHPSKNARGRQVDFLVNLQDLKTRELPALDDAFAKQASEKETLVELRADLEQRLRDDVERQKTNNRHDALLKALVEQLEVDLPETLVERETRNLVEQTAEQFAHQGVDVKSLLTPEFVRNLMKSSRPEAERRLRRSLALTTLARDEQLKLEESVINAKMQELSRQLSGQGGFSPQHLRQAVTNSLLQDLLLKWLEENSTIIEVKPEPNPK